MACYAFPAAFSPLSMHRPVYITAPKAFPVLPAPSLFPSTAFTTHDRPRTMRFAASTSILLGLAPIALGQNTTFLAGLLQSLTASGHTQLATTASQLNSSAAGQSVLSQLSSGSPFVLFAPSNQACECLLSNGFGDVAYLPRCQSRTFPLM